MLRYLFLLFTFPCFSLVYDCFLFFNEIELLEIRLREMHEAVDHFVLVESVETFRGNPKPLHFLENQHRFAPYRDKIIHIIVDHRLQTHNPWAREAFQRDQILQGLRRCRNDDIILISDLDEIIRGKDMPTFLAPLLEKKHPAVTAQHRFYIGRMNRLNPGFNSRWNGTVATTFGHLNQHSPQILRSGKDRNPNIPDIGWHFTSVGSTEVIVAKIEATSHQECDTPENKDPIFIKKWISELELVPIDSSFPLLVQERENYYRQIGWID